MGRAEHPDLRTEQGTGTVRRGFYGKPSWRLSLLPHEGKSLRRPLHQATTSVSCLPSQHVCKSRGPLQGPAPGPNLASAHSSSP